MLFLGAVNRHLEKYLQDETLNVECKNLVNSLKTQMSTRFKNIEDNELVCQATFLDPRFKKYGFLRESKFEATYNTLRNKLAAVNIHVPLQTETNAKRQCHDSNNFTSLWGDFDTKVEQMLAKNNPTAAGIIEMDKYLQEPFIGRLEDPLVWWQQKKDIYPRLYQMVLKRLCILATSVPCERLFSKAGQILCEKRSRLGATKVSQILFLNGNLE